MNSSDKQPITINIVQGSQGAEFDSSEFQIVAGVATIWVNQTESPQVIIPDNQNTRRVMTIALNGQKGAIWMMQMRSSQESSSPPGTFRWRLQSNSNAHITTTVP
jgi:hypothetical protein